MYNNVLEVVFAQVFKKTFRRSTTGSDVLVYKRFKILAKNKTGRI